ncbi:intradiol ring-cleavage dioxygenase [Sphingobium subterraneum]|uniref:Catechol 1,2-dioxygenase n=1 Tax=Sphingobium subterraneum TaxID=627688 RepID=A0A841IWR7_9SPHN|nr:intradiol ring-cleavage dioxygenase [Sphingobium subterraneum]MBB6123087.1 catechol 1,2-dioxygenase [Sphingobium subterraneum]
MNDTLEAEPAVYFTEENSEEAVIARMRSDCDPRLRTVMSAAIRHLHAFVKEIEPTDAEWGATIEFLTRTGQISTDWRQEYILLSDILGVSMLVDAINNRKPSGATETTVLGPFHVADVPRLELGANLCLDGKGEPIFIEGRITSANGTPIAGALIDVWQCNDEGFYDVQQADVQPPMNLRGMFETDEDGNFWFRSVKPRYYPIPTDGPVGKLLQAMGRHPYRPAHVHFIVSAPGYRSVTTHLFVPDCPYLGSDAVFGVKESLIAQINMTEPSARSLAAGLDSAHWHLKYDFVLVPQE